LPGNVVLARKLWPIAAIWMAFGLIGFCYFAIQLLDPATPLRNSLRIGAALSAFYSLPAFAVLVVIGLMPRTSVTKRQRVAGLVLAAIGALVLVAELPVLREKVSPLATSREVAASSFASTWPLIFPRGLLACEDSAEGPIVTFVHDATIYAVNDTAQSVAAARGFRSIEFIRRESPYLGGKAPLDELVAQGLALCRADRLPD